MQVEFKVNGRPVSADIPPHTLLVQFLREHLRLTGTHTGCDTAQCGACTVLVDGRAIKSCNTLAVQLQGADITTIEGLAAADGTPHPLQEAFVDQHGLQCGFCTPGFLMTAACLLRHEAQPDEATVVHALEGNLCRCTGYVNIVAAVRQAAPAADRAAGGAA